MPLTAWLMQLAPSGSSDGAAPLRVTKAMEPWGEGMRVRQAAARGGPAGAGGRIGMRTARVLACVLAATFSTLRAAHPGADFGSTGSAGGGGALLAGRRIGPWCCEHLMTIFTFCFCRLRFIKIGAKKCAPLRASRPPARWRCPQEKRSAGGACRRWRRMGQRPQRALGRRAAREPCRRSPPRHPSPPRLPYFQLAALLVGRRVG